MWGHDAAQDLLITIQQLRECLFQQAPDVLWPSRRAV